MISFDRFTLDNGLRVIHNYDPTVAQVAVNIIYNVGARDEQRSLTGLAHLFEHLMFGGSVNEPDFDGEMERAGGTTNAWTTNDHTNFYDLLPAANLATALRLESDRMLSPLLTDASLAVQRSVVIEEFNQMCLNQPYGDLWHHLRALAYNPEHPYSWPVLGLTPEHVAGVTRAHAEEFFFSHYAPNNAVLAVCGNVHPDLLRSEVERWFASIPRRHTAPRTYGPTAPVTAPRELTVRGRVPQTQISIAFPMPGRPDKGYVEADLITDILASGRASRFYRELLSTDPLFSTADASILGSEEPGLLILTARLSSDRDADIDRARNLLMEKAMQLVADGPSEEELLRAKNRYDSTTTFSHIHYLAKAQSLAMAEMQDTDINSLPETYRRVTLADLREAAAKILRPESVCTLIYRPLE